MSKAELQDLFLNALASGADQSEEQRRMAKLLANDCNPPATPIAASTKTWKNVIAANFSRQPQVL